MVKRSENGSCQDRKHYFFKIMLPGLPTQQLRIPPNFTRHISKRAAGRAILEDRKGYRWFVKLKQTSSGIYLGEGWQDFLVDHSILDNEFLLFRYDGNLIFNVKIFGKNGCERDASTFTLKTDQVSTFSNRREKGTSPSRNHVACACACACASPSLSKVCRDDPGKHLESRKRLATEEEKIRVQEAAESFISKFPYFKRRLNASNVYVGFVLILRS
ncbi:PREDICTED: B3 domain-containing protein Os01g0723500-like isoform X3 [Nelumbo nucifera]|uniref:B3 domain-containing protein Os01g0723500-like isoform X3 n=1 Tax=Nelumbo nucifera TaxID=4432 RepID=A0A1U8AL94_NELNU|nr:PREDICTED: B3 domain-containing protein Os01g0723500-like isoform X3 [Nelumbo nucifera]